MGYYLLDHPNPHGPHFYVTRRGTVKAIVVHITAGLEDLDATNDQSAENTARYAATTDRPVSWHSGSDSDTAFDLLPASYTAFQCRGYNSTTYGHEISKADPDWRDAPEPWRTRTIGLAGRHLGAKARQMGIPIRKATKAELDHAIATDGPPVGFIGHHVLDEGRRLDPGLVGAVDTFPWGDFLAAASNQEDQMTPAQEAKLNRLIESVGTLREHEKAHYDAVQAKVRDLATELAAVKAQVDPDADLTRRGSGARRGVQDVVRMTLAELKLDERLAAIEAHLGIGAPAEPG